MFPEIIHINVKTEWTDEQIITFIPIMAGFLYPHILAVGKNVLPPKSWHKWLETWCKGLYKKRPADFSTIFTAMIDFPEYQNFSKYVLQFDGEIVSGDIYW